MAVQAGWLRGSSSLQLSLFALALVACATAEDSSTGGVSGGPPINTAGTGTTGGSGSTTAGTSALPLAGTTALPQAGTTSTPGTGGTASATGGTGTSAAGTTATTGGTVAAGGTTSSTCAQYSGTLAKDSVFFDAGFGHSAAGAWSGYGYTYKYGTATISPGTGNGCFAGKKFCANGSVPAADTSGAGLGWNIAQMMGASTQGKAAITSAVTVKFAGLPAGSRVQLSASSTTSYCYSLSAAEITAGGATIPAASFKKDCWDAATAVAYDSTVMIEAIQIAVPGSAAAAAATAFDFCITDIEPG